MKIRVLRAFIFGGEPVEPDTELDVPVAFAREMIAVQKAEAVNASDLIPSGPLDVSNAGALVNTTEKAAK